ncbi:MAG: ABC transporter substrate-binding protein [Chloroflexi bacterium]|nr:ABC transporter substrate-binding protein [Chloroflexota bacterium]
MSRRNLLLMSLIGVVVIAVGVFLLVSSGEEEDDSTQESFTIGVVNLGPALEPVFDGFKSRMTELGYVEGENITYLYNGSVGDIALLDAEAQKMVDADVDLILTLSTPASQAAKRVTATNQIPVVFAPITDPVATGLVESLANPTGNLTGVTFGPQEGLRMEWLTRIDPTIERVWIPYNADDASPVAALAILEANAEALGVEYVPVVTRNLDEINTAIENIPDDVDAIFLLPDTFTVSNVELFIQVALDNDLPMSVPSYPAVSEGALISYSMDFIAVGEQAARLAAQILEGAEPSDLPVEVSEFFLTINLHTADEIGLEIGDDILRQADDIVRE